MCLTPASPTPPLPSFSLAHCPRAVLLVSSLTLRPEAGPGLGKVTTEKRQEWEAARTQETSVPQPQGRHSQGEKSLEASGVSPTSLCYGEWLMEGWWGRRR